MTFSIVVRSCASLQADSRSNHSIKDRIKHLHVRSLTTTTMLTVTKLPFLYRRARLLQTYAVQFFREKLSASELAFSPYSQRCVQLFRLNFVSQAHKRLEHPHQHQALLFNAALP